MPWRPDCLTFSDFLMLSDVSLGLILILRLITVIVFVQSLNLMTKEEDTSSHTTRSLNNEKTKGADNPTNIENEGHNGRTVKKNDVSADKSAKSSMMGHSQMNTDTEMVCDKAVKEKDKKSKQKSKKSHQTMDQKCDDRTIFTISDSLNSDGKNGKNSNQRISSFKLKASDESTSGWSGASPPGPVDN